MQCKLAFIPASKNKLPRAVFENILFGWTWSKVWLWTMCPPIQLISFWVVLNMIQIWKPHLILITTVTQWDGAKRNNLRSLVVWLWPVWCHQFGVASVAPSTICIINQDFHSTHQVSWWIWRTVNWRQVQWNISGVSQWMCMQLITLQSGQWQISLVHLSCCCQCPLLIRSPVQCPVSSAIELTMLQMSSSAPVDPLCVPLCMIRYVDCLSVCLIQQSSENTAVQVGLINWDRSYWTCVTQPLDDLLLTHLDCTSIADTSTREGEKLNDQAGRQDTGKLDILAPG